VAHVGGRYAPAPRTTQEDDVSKVRIGAFEVIEETVATLSRQGALLIPGGERVNPMTIGWGLLGVTWGKPIFAVLVRPTRFTYTLLERTNVFSVNVPSAAQAHACTICGSQSGRDVDKIALTGLTVERGRELDVPTVGECPIHYECRVVHTSRVDPRTLLPEIDSSTYRSGDHHKVYWGEIVAAFRTV
jgi:flavin reductase (DIM6/NTAB) family NADH-FMN oxidoreductase RutF